VLPRETARLAAARAGRVRRSPFEEDRPASVADVVAVLEALTNELRIADLRLVATDDAPGFHPARAAALLADGDRIGVVGEIDAGVVDALDLPQPVVAFELDADRLRAALRSARRSSVISRFPASIIDLAFVVDDTVPASDILATLRESAGELLERVELFDVFRSEAIGGGRVSLAFTVSFRAPDRTLTDEEVAALRVPLIAAVTKRHHAELRA
jgi:phenylalanyl-tRNA synthetase beta chain